MNRLRVICFLLLVTSFLFSVTSSPLYAAENPLAVPNNKIGVHILFPNELPDAVKLINSNGGDWGYVTIPIQSGDRDIEKWQHFFDEARANHIIPLIRLATEGDYFNTKVWRKPTNADILDFANFLDSLNWPTKNRYIIVFNEVNRGDEWGGTPDADEYADLLSYAVSVFKAKNHDYFIISSGMDNAAATTDSSIDEYTYLTEMNTHTPGIFNQIDGMASHSYPNPGFSQPPTTLTGESISSFSFENALIKRLSLKDLPVFITETGWSTNAIDPSVVGEYFKKAFATIWNDPRIVAITPFLLHPNGAQWGNFSFLNINGSPNDNYKVVYDLHKTKGLPKLSSVLAAAIPQIHDIPAERFLASKDKPPFISTKNLSVLFHWLLKIN